MHVFWAAGSVSVQRREGSRAPDHMTRAKIPRHKRTSAPFHTSCWRSLGSLTLSPSSLLSIIGNSISHAPRFVGPSLLRSNEVVATDRLTCRRPDWRDRAQSVSSRGLVVPQRFDQRAQNGQRQKFVTAVCRVVEFGRNPRMP